MAGDPSTSPSDGGSSISSKGIYLGVAKRTGQVLYPNNIDTFFTVTDDSSAFMHDADTGYFNAAKAGISYEYGQAFFKAKQDITFNLNYGYSLGDPGSNFVISGGILDSGKLGPYGEGVTEVTLKKDETITATISLAESNRGDYAGFRFQRIIKEESVARKVKNIYIGVGGVARKVKKAYIGINGVARLCYSNVLIEYVKATNLPFARGNLAGASVSNYALFAGGETNSDYTSNVDAYNSSLTRISVSPLTDNKASLSGASVGNYALFAGGYKLDNVRSLTVDAYNISLTKSSPSSLTMGRGGLAGASVGNYALFAGGRTGSGPSSIVNGYTNSLALTSVTTLMYARQDLAGASVGNYALFAGGDNGSPGVGTTVDAYNTSLVRSTPTSISSGVNGSAYMGSASTNNYALFAGGFNFANGSKHSGVWAYNSSLVRSTPTNLPYAVYGLAGVSVKGNALFAGGTDDMMTYNSVVVYNPTLVRTTGEGLSTARTNLAGASVSNHALFAGGMSGTSSGRVYHSTVDAYKINA